MNGVKVPIRLDGLGNENGLFLKVLELGDDRQMVSVKTEDEHRDR
jgi:hypothetical protein